MILPTESDRDELWECAMAEASEHSRRTGESVSLLAQQYFEEFLEAAEESGRLPNPITKWARSARNQ